MKKIVTIQDISCFGKCSLTVALPIVSAMGVETAIIPTAVLSTHTMFQNFTVKDLSDQIEPISEHWKQEKLRFDALYTGYLGSFEQIDMMKRFFEDFGQGTLKFVDPAMGDNGKLYPAFDEKFAKYMSTLCAKADIIDPNITEACFMLGEEYIAEGYSRDYIESILKRLAALGPRYAVLTGMSFEKMADRMTPQAEMNIKSRLALEAVAKAEGMEVTDADVEAELEKRAKQFYMDPAEYKRLLGDDGVKELRTDILVEKAANFIVDEAKETKEKKEGKEEEGKNAESGSSDGE